MEKKKKSESFIIPATHFRNNSYSITEVKPVGSVQSQSSIISDKIEDDKNQVEEKKEQIVEKSNESKPINKQFEDNQIETTEIIKTEIIPTTNNQPLTTQPKVSAFSLAGLRAKKELEAKQTAHLSSIERLPTESFSETDLLLLWNKYAQRLSDTGKKLMSTYMLMNEPKVNGSTIILELPNQSTKEEFLSGSIELIGYLRGKLHNHDLVIEVLVNETVEKKICFYTRRQIRKIESYKSCHRCIEKDF